MNCSTTINKGHVHPVNTQISLGCLLEENFGPYSYTLSVQRRLVRLGGCPADLNLRWVHRSFCWYCNASAQMVSVNTCGEESTIYSFAIEINSVQLYLIMLF